MAAQGSWEPAPIYGGDRTDADRALGMSAVGICGSSGAAKDSARSTTADHILRGFGVPTALLPETSPSLRGVLLPTGDPIPEPAGLSIHGLLTTAAGKAVHSRHISPQQEKAKRQAVARRKRADEFLEFKRQRELQAQRWHAELVLEQARLLGANAASMAQSQAAARSAGFKRRRDLGTGAAPVRHVIELPRGLAKR